MKSIRSKFAASSVALMLMGLGQVALAEGEVWTPRTVSEVQSQIIVDENGNQSYTIQWGDTLFTIAQATNVSVEKLAEINAISNADLIYPGTRLVFSADRTIMTAENVVTNEVTTYDLTTPTAQPVASQVAVPVETPATPEVVAPVPAVQYEAVANDNYVAQPEVVAPAPVETPNYGGRQITVEATAYGADCAGCSGITANGTALYEGARVIAVDPNVIPLGTRVYVPGYGEAIAADTGGAIQGNIIDVFMGTEANASSWGRQTVTITILD